MNDHTTEYNQGHAAALDFLKRRQAEPVNPYVRREARRRWNAGYTVAVMQRGRPDLARLKCGTCREPQPPGPNCIAIVVPFHRKPRKLGRGVTLLEAA